MNTEKIKEFKNYVKTPFSQVGGYSYFFLTSCGCMCAKCAKKNKNNVIHSLKNDIKDEFYYTNIAINFEDNSLYCDTCSNMIDPEYGDYDIKDNLTDYQ